MTLILPKQVGTLDRTILSLQICKDYKELHNSPIPNIEFKEEIVNRIDEFDSDTNEPLIIKQSEIARYFGLIDNFNWQRQKQITPIGEYFLQNVDSKEVLSEIILEVLEKNEITFGRNSQAVETSDSDIEPPKLILQSILILGYCVKNEIAYILNQTHVKDIYYEDVLDTIKLSREDSDWSDLSQRDFKELYIDQEYHNKFYDLKFINFFVQIGLLEVIDDKYVLSSFAKTNFAERIYNLSIYNTFTYRKTSEQSIVLKSSIKLRKYKKSILSKDPTLFGSKKPNKVVKANTSGYERDPKVVLWVLETANGNCENCESPAPFFDKDGYPYLEVHHVKYLSQGGSDSTTNSVALCPNCHRRVHFSSDGKDVTNSLYEKVVRLIKE